MLASWFGKYDFEDKEKTVSTPWHEQLIKDLELVDEMEGWAGFSSKIGNDPLKLFKDEELKRQFLTFDQKLLRATLMKTMQTAFIKKRTHLSLMSLSMIFLVM